MVKQGYEFPRDISIIRQEVSKILMPVTPANNETKAPQKFLFTAQKSEASKELPSYYLCYFLLVELLKYRNLGRSEKIAWSVPIDFHGEAFLIEHRKFGIGLFCRDAEEQKDQAHAIVKRLNRAVNFAKPYFDWLALEATRRSELNVQNYNYKLYSRYSYLLELYKALYDEAEERKHEIVREQHGEHAFSAYRPSTQIKQNAKWIALSTIEAFFSWTEHIFIHIAILNGQAKTGEEVAKLAETEWSTKFKISVGLVNKESKEFYDQLVLIKRQVRNYVAHGAFGKNGEAFYFHSRAGAVPILLNSRKGKGRFAFSENLAFEEQDAINLIENFISYLSSGHTKIAMLYVNTELPTILTMAADGTYSMAMNSTEEMQEFIERQVAENDVAVNMDW